MEMSDQQKLRVELLTFQERINDELQLIINRYCLTEHLAPRPKRFMFTLPNGKERDVLRRGKNGRIKKSNTGRQ